MTAATNERKMKNISDTALRISETSNGDVVLPLHDYTDVGNARAFAALYGEELAFTVEWGWCYFCGLNWEIDQEYQAQTFGVEFAENVKYVAKEYLGMLMDKCEDMGCTPDSKEGKEIIAPAVAFMKHADKTNSERGIRAMLKLAEGMMRVPASTFDSNGWVLNTPGVVVDLRTGETYPPVWNQFNSMLTALPYDSSAESNGIWLEFLDTIFKGDTDLINFVQMQFGSTLVGKVYEENLLIANGDGSNGKSTLFSILKAILADYCTSVNPDILMNKVSYEQQIAVAQIKGKRLVMGQETESGQILSTASVKRMVSTDTMVGRVLNHGYIEFQPTHSMMLATNHLPKVRDNDDGTWRRLTVVPFDAKIKKEQMITNLQDILLAEDGAFILHWLVDGARMFYENGCKFPEPPSCIALASRKYRETQRELIDVFIDEKLQIVNPVRHPKTWMYPNDVYGLYLEWCADKNLEHPLSKVAVSRKLTSRGVQTAQRWIDNKSVRVWMYVARKGEEVVQG